MARPIVPFSGGDREEWKDARLRFARHMLQNLPPRHSVIFVDESMFRVSDDRKVQWVRPGEPTATRETLGHSSQVHVWGAIGVGFRCLFQIGEGSGLRGGMTSKDYVASLEKHFLPAGCEVHVCAGRVCVGGSALLGPGRVFAQDEKSASSDSHWPPYSPDLNPIEKGHQPTSTHCPDQKKRSENKLKLWELIRKVWDETTDEAIARLLDSWPRRLRLCVEKSGDFTGY